MNSQTWNLETLSRGKVGPGVYWRQWEIQLAPALRRKGKSGGKLADDKHHREP
jgi:hypothetical protein